jgi:uroporphyrinogen-III synthase
MDDTRPLAGCGIVVTRPAHQADELCAAIASAGGEAFRFPTVAIRGLEHALPGGTIEWWVFVSPNAVAHAGALLAARGAAVSAGRIAALGPSTAAALRAAGVTVAVEAPDGLGSEGLLADRRFDPASGARIAIVRGVGGRELIAETLEPRGIEVLRVEVYERGLPEGAAVEAATVALTEAWSAGRVHAVIATSNALLENLHRLLDDRGRALLAGSQVVATSGRVLQLARQLGIRPVPLIAGSATSAALVATLARWWRPRD